MHKQDNKAKRTHESQMIYMQAGWSTVKQAVGPKHINTSGDYSVGVVVVLHQMLPRGSTTSTRSLRALKCMPCLNNHYIRPQKSLLCYYNPISHTHTHSQEDEHTQTHSDDAHSGSHKHIPADLDLPPVCVCV